MSKKANKQLQQSEIKTIWKYGFVFFDNKKSAENFRHETPDVQFCGHIDDIPEQVANEIVEIHPNFEAYYDSAMMPLYKTYHNYKNGTESPHFAVKSLRTDKEWHLEYVVIWRIIPN